ncbi:ComF family protein [bacterium]|nr:ComF family protein [bacterium]
MPKARPLLSVTKVHLPIFLGNLRNSLSSLLFPWPCPGCNILLEYPDVMCADCELSLPKIREPFCLRCGMAFPQHWKVKICPECHQHKHRITTIRSAYEYEGLAAQMIKDAKYLRKGRYLHYFADQLFVLARADFPPSINAVVPVPLHKNREWARTFNQAEILAARIAKLWDLPLWNALKKISKTKPQSSLSGSTRRFNLQNVFQFRGKRPVKSVLLVDDVITTGSTLNECARILRQNGVKRIYAVTIARAELR